MSTWTGQDWSFFFGGIALLITSFGGFIGTMVGLYKLNKKVDGMLVDRDASKVAEGRKQETDATAFRDEGRRQEREESAAVHATTLPSGIPLPVADERTAKAAEDTAVAAADTAAATNRIADAAQGKK